jgi:hypothetical protein
MTYTPFEPNETFPVDFSAAALGDPPWLQEGDYLDDDADAPRRFAAGLLNGLLLSAALVAGLAAVVAAALALNTWLALGDSPLPPLCADQQCPANP